MIGRVVLALTLLVAVASAQNFGRVGPSLSRPPAFNPLGLAYIPDFGFVVSSQKYGNLYFVEDGKAIQLFSNATAGWATTGLSVDATRRLVYVAANNGTLSNVASIVSLSKKDGSLKGTWDLSGLLPSIKKKFLANVAADAAGNLYATDAYQGVIYKADRNGEATVWVKDSSLLPQDSLGFGVNGIAFVQGNDPAYPSGFFLVSRSGLTEAAGGLLRISIDTRAILRTSLSHGNFSGLFGSFGELIVNPRSGRAYTVASDNSVYEFNSNDNWQSAVITAQYRVACTSPVALQYVQSPYNDIYVLCNSGVAPYKIERVQVAKYNVIPFVWQTASANDASAVYAPVSKAAVMLALVAMLLAAFL